MMLAGLNAIKRVPVLTKSAPSKIYPMYPPCEKSIKIVVSSLKRFKEVSRTRLAKMCGLSVTTVSKVMCVLISKDEAIGRKFNNGKQIEFMYRYTKTQHIG